MFLKQLIHRFQDEEYGLQFELSQYNLLLILKQTFFHILR